MKLHTLTTGAGADLVLLHGWGMNGAVWSSILPALEQRFRVTLIELPGHGASTYQQGQADLDVWVDACLDVAPAQAHWIGWSLGGQIAQRAALIAPQRFKRLMLVCSTPRFVQADDWLHAMLQQTLQQFAGTLTRDHQQTLARFLSLQVQGDERARETLRQLRHEIAERPAPDQRALEHGLELLLTVDLRSQLSQLRCATLWVFGERDTLVPAGVEEALRLLHLPDAQFSRLPGCAHAPFISHPEQSLELIKCFFEDPDERSAG